MRRHRAEVIVITGGSAGVGRATARALARPGARIAVLARASDDLDDVEPELIALGARAIALPVDVADADAVEAATERIEQELGPIDVWINNATTSVFSPVHETTADEYRRVTEVTYLGYVFGTLAALRRMRPRGSGVIIQVSSALAFRSIPLQSAYCAAKHAIKGFTESLRCELIHDRIHIHVGMVHLPAINTPQFDWNRSRLPRRAQPVPPIFQPEVAARAIAWAVQHRRRDLWVGWPTFKAIVGNRVVPGLLDRLLAARGYRDQQTREPARPHADNLFAPVKTPHGAHGRFDDRARSSSAYLWLTTHRALLAALVGMLLVLALLRAG